MIEGLAGCPFALSLSHD